MTRETVLTDKDTQREHPPDILLTNYKMLDYLLMRPKDQPLWRFNARETLRYLIVDELHTFDGAQGTDLACLIRRLKARLQTPRQHLIAIGTSATLGSGDEGTQLAAYAGRIFQEPFDDAAIIHESRQERSDFLGDEFIEYQFFPPADLGAILDPARYESTAEFLKAQYQLFFPEQLDARPDDPIWRCELGGQLKRHLLFYNLLKLLVNRPKALQELSAELERALPPGDSRRMADRLLDSLCALIACARNPDDPVKPLVNLRLQLWVRELRRMVTPLSDDPATVELTFADDIKQKQSELHLPLVQCSECHASAWLTSQPDAHAQINQDLRAIYNGFFQRHHESKLLFPLLADELPPAAPGFTRRLCAECGNVQATGAGMRINSHQPEAVVENEQGPKSTGHGGMCQACGADRLIPVFVPDLIERRKTNGQDNLTSEHHCPVCASKNSMMVFGSRSASLSSVAVFHTFASRYNDDKKLIAFS
ncbi:MAG: DEAD/DEAH box helicase, partial [Pseudomonadota bacterium]